MKIFTWVHKRFQRSIPKDKLDQNEDKTETDITSVDKDTQSLLKQASLVDMLDGWKDGIFSIGTFGFEPLKPFHQQKEYLILEKEEDDKKIISLKSSPHEKHEDYGEDNNNVEDEESNPLIPAARHSYVEFSSNYDSNVENSNLLLTIDADPLTPILVESAAESGIEDDISRIDEKKKKSERTTLAELFLADSDYQMKLDSGKTLPGSSKKMKVERKKSLSFAKKIIPRFKEESRPIKNMQILMRKILKRKIHPEVDMETHKSDSNKISAAEILITNGDLEAASESVYLLPISGGITEL